MRAAARMAAASALLGLCASPAGAQDLGQTSLAIGYGTARDREDLESSTDPITYNPSLVVSVTARGARPVSGVMEFGWAQGAALYPYARGGLNGRERRMTFLGGVRLSGHGTTTAFGQMLIGYVRESFQIFANGSSGSGVHPSGFLMQPGAGVDIAISPRAGVRLQGDLVFQSRDVLQDTGESRRKLIRLTASVVMFFPNR